MDNDSKVVLKTVKEILKLLSITPEELSVTTKDDYTQVKIITSESAALIGHHGENIASLQLIIRLIVYQKTGKWQKINLNVNDWQEKREEYLKNMASNFAQKVKFSGKEACLPLLSATERRIIHLYLADHPDVETVSEGEGSERRLIIRPKKINA
jgi:spoIIIJ-associated protein